MPLDLGRPLWVDDPHFNIGYHVRHTALPPPGGDEELRNLVGRVMSQQLDRTKPLWEMWMVEGLEDGHWAIISKVHHAMVDGVSGTDLLTVVLDQDPSPPPPESRDWEPAPEPSNTALFTDAVRDRVVNPYEQFRALRSGLRGPRALRTQLGDVGKGLRSLVTAVRGSPEAASWSCRFLMAHSDGSSVAYADGHAKWVNGRAISYLSANATIKPSNCNPTWTP